MAVRVLPQGGMAVDLVKKIATGLAATQYEDLPKEAVTATKQHILDSLGVIVGGSSAAGCDIVVDLVAGWEGREESSILVHGIRVPAPNAALANATMGHARDFDANHDAIGYKGSVAAIPAALATAQWKKEVSGRHFITAVALGVDLGCRMGLATRPSGSHAYARALGCFAAAAAAGKLMDLDEQQMSHALGIAYGEVAMGGGAISHPSLTKRLGAGLAARGGVFSALLASRGFAGPRDFLLGERGYYPLYTRHDCDTETLTSEFGSRFEIVNLGFKPYPCCRVVHGPIDAALRLVREHAIQAEEVEKVSISISRQDFETLGLSNPNTLRNRLTPRGTVDAQFSPHYGVAVAVVKQKVLIEHYTDQGIRDTDILSMAHKVTAIVDPELDRAPRFIKPCVVEIRLVGGITRAMRVDIPKGDPTNPMSQKEMEGKFEDCMHNAAKPLPREQWQKLVHAVAVLEDVDDAGILAELLVGQPISGGS